MKSFTLQTRKNGDAALFNRKDSRQSVDANRLEVLIEECPVSVSSRRCIDTNQCHCDCHVMRSGNVQVVYRSAIHVIVALRLIRVMEVTCAAQAMQRLRALHAIRLALTVRFSLMMLVLSSVAGCSSIGPGSVPRDRLDYISAIGKFWKEQTLLNVVRLRYGDAPTVPKSVCRFV